MKTLKEFYDWLCEHSVPRARTPKAPVASPEARKEAAVQKLAALKIVP